MSQREIPCLLMRGGSSRGPVFLRDDLPAERDELARALAAAVGAGHPLTIDGLGGGAPVTTKVVMLSRSERADADIDYFFAQVQPASALVDFAPTCGNMLAAVGPAAVETGLVAAADGETRLRILAINTGALVESVVQTPGGRVEYAGAATVDGVPGTAAPVRLDFMNVVGSGTGVLFPTGARRDVVGGVEATCIDVAVPMVLARAGEFGLTGYESPAEIDADAELRARICLLYTS
ncbi:MAG: 4-oxalomesaconate tautomerase, partial [Alphaproteobacteria bacterium]|nr:4-oxalomesaconate tautomerase [Alphaproteobacteria bacterium]